MALNPTNEESFEVTDPLNRNALALYRLLATPTQTWINEVNRDGKRPLELALRPKFQKGLIKILLRNGADPNFSVEKENPDEFEPKVSPFLHAVIGFEFDESKVESVQVLLDHEASIFARDDRNRTALYHALHFNDSVTNKIVEHGCTFPPENFGLFYRLCRCILADDIERAKILLKKIPDVDFKDMKEITPLNLATYEGNLKFMKLLLEKGANINYLNIYGETPLRYVFAIEEIWEVGMKFLLEHGADPNVKLPYDSEVYPLHLAFQYSDMNTIKLLMRYGANIKAMSSTRKNMLSFAISNRRIEPLKYLLDNKICNINNVDRLGYVPLFGVTRNVECQNTTLCLERGARWDLHTCKMPHVGFELLPLRDCITTLSHPKELCPVLKHFEKLKFLGYKCEPILVDGLFGRGDNLDKDHFLNSIVERPEFSLEVEELKRVQFSILPRKSLYDALFFKNRDLTILAKSKLIDGTFRKFGKNFEKRFLNFGFILNNIYEKLQEKRDLLEKSGRQFCLLIGQSTAKLILELIFENLSNEDLKILNRVRLKKK